MFRRRFGVGRAIGLLILVSFVFSGGIAALFAFPRGEENPPPSSSTSEKTNPPSTTIVDYFPNSSSSSVDEPVRDASSDTQKIEEFKTLEIKQPEPIKQNITFVNKDEHQEQRIPLKLECDGSVAITLTEVYNGTYYEMALYNQYGDRCANVTDFSYHYPNSSNLGKEYDSVKAGNYYVKISYSGRGTPTALLTIYKPNKTVDITDYLNNGIITDGISAPWLRNTYKATVKEDSTFVIFGESSDGYFEMDIIDSYNNVVKELNGLKEKRTIELPAGEYTFDVHCLSDAATYRISINRLKPSE